MNGKINILFKNHILTKKKINTKSYKEMKKKIQLNYYINKLIN